jgi:hypothetical protein
VVIYIIIKMSMGTLPAIGSYTTSTQGDRLYPITIQIQNRHGGWTPVRALSDTGNEISIFKKEVAEELGLNMEDGEHFKVAGINGQGREFRRFKLMVKIGNLEPIRATIGFAMNKGDLVENLLGNADVLKSGKFQVTYDKDTVTYTQKALNARVSSCDAYGSEQEILNQLYDHLTTRRKRGEKHSREKASEDLKDGGGHNSISGYGVYY